VFSGKFETSKPLKNFLGGWHGEHLFISHSHPSCWVNPPLDSKTFLYFFDFNQSKWSQICSMAKWFTQGCISCKLNDGILSILNYDTEYDSSIKNCLPLICKKITLIRLSLG
jgi:hypothetical protein